MKAWPLTVLWRRCTAAVALSTGSLVSLTRHAAASTQRWHSQSMNCSVCCHRWASRSYEFTSHPQLPKHQSHKGYTYRREYWQASHSMRCLNDYSLWYCYSTPNQTPVTVLRTSIHQWTTLIQSSIYGRHYSTCTRMNCVDGEIILALCWSKYYVCMIVLSSIYGITI